MLGQRSLGGEASATYEGGDERLLRVVLKEAVARRFGFHLGLAFNGEGLALMDCLSGPVFLKACWYPSATSFALPLGPPSNDQTVH